MSTQVPPPPALAESAQPARESSDGARPPDPRGPTGLSTPAPLTRLDLLWALAIALWGVAMLAPGLAHPGIHNWDEALHQAAARGVYDSFFYPHVYADPLWPLAPEHWWTPQVWLHKPTGPLWFAALVMKVTGVSPWALRLASLLGELLAAGCLYALARPLAGRLAAGLVSLGFLSLPFGWILTQGLMFGDVTDTTLTGLVALSFWMLVRAIDGPAGGTQRGAAAAHGSRWAILSGAALGAAYLCKTVLALVPWGTALVLFLLRRLGFCRGPTAKQLALMTAAGLAVAAPWNVYCAVKWPDVYWADARITLGHALKMSGVDVGVWARPFDAILNEMNATGFDPLPTVLPLLAGLWLVVRGLLRRETATVACASWVWATWLVHSLLTAKAPGHTWSAVPGVLLGLALVASDARRYPALAGALLGGLATPWLVRHAPALGHLRLSLPTVGNVLVQTRSVPGLVEGAVACAVGAAASDALFRLVRRPGWLGTAALAASLLSLGWMFVVRAPGRIAEEREAKDSELFVSYARELGLALDAALPQRSVLFQDFDLDHPGTFETHSTMFWSGRMTYRMKPDLARAAERGYHPYLLSPVAEPYAPVEAVPAHAWMRAYDLLAPRSEPAPLPSGALPLDVEVGPDRVLAVAAGPNDSQRDKYVFYVKPGGTPEPLEVLFIARDGRQTRAVVQPEASLRQRQRLAGSAWFLLPVLGPKRELLTAIALGPERRRIDWPR